jgi:hypothetical protein
MLYLYFCSCCCYRDGTTHVVLEPLDFMARLAALRQAAGFRGQLHG